MHMIQQIGMTSVNASEMICMRANMKGSQLEIDPLIKMTETINFRVKASR